MSKQYSLREVQAILKKNGYKPLRMNKGSHQIFSNGQQRISLPMVSLNYKLANKIVKQCEKR